MSYGMGGMGYGYPLGGMNQMMNQGVPNDPNINPSPIFLLRDVLRTAGESVALIQGFKMLLGTVSEWAGQGNAKSSNQIVNTAVNIATSTAMKKGKKRYTLRFLKLFTTVFVGCFLFYTAWKQWRAFRRTRARALLKSRNLLPPPRNTASIEEAQQTINRPQKQTTERRLSVDSVLDGLSKEQKALYACWSNIVEKKSAKSQQNISKSETAISEVDVETTSTTPLLSTRTPNKPSKPYHMAQSSHNNAIATAANSKAITNSTMVVDLSSSKQCSPQYLLPSQVLPLTSASTHSETPPSWPSTPCVDRTEKKSQQQQQNRVRPSERRKSGASGSLLHHESKGKEAAHSCAGTAVDHEENTSALIMKNFENRRRKKKEIGMYWSVYE
eukprot:GDKK01018821.1.p1 GENE.GDKK01018821.1~~GDKK01018821.1.p1  ORF type:complete len:399 (-),score=85.34 GDKK01018821.1:877-2031(-)